MIDGKPPNAITNTVYASLVTQIEQCRHRGSLNPHSDPINILGPRPTQVSLADIGEEYITYNQVHLMFLRR